MAFSSGKLVKVGTYVIPLGLINADSYDCTPDQRQDVDSYRDLNQDLHRNVADHYKSVVKFKTRPHLEESELRPLIDGIKSNYINTKERKVHLEYFNTETGNYSNGDFYVVQPKFTIMQINGDLLFYDAMEFEFIEY